MQLSRLRQMLGVALVLIAGLFATTGIRAQDPPFVVRGTVLDANTRRPLAGATVLLQGAGIRTTLRAVTGANGEYTLQAPVSPGAYTLHFSMLARGAESRSVRLGTQRAVQVDPVLLAEVALELEQLVVTGTGSPVERRAVGNTIATVHGEAVNEAPAATAVDKALQGKIAGAEILQNSGQPGGGVSIRLRGTSSILGGSDPLIVIDGVIVDNNSDALISVGSNATNQGAALSNRLSDIAPGDIERIEVLKGASAAALYGSRANNGVIQIFTKKGRQGRPQITFRSEFSASETPERYDLVTAPVAGRADVAFGLAQKVGDPIERFDLQDQIFRTGYGAQTQLSVSGGSEETSYYLSGSWIDQTGTILATGHDKYNVLGKLTQRLSDNIEIGATANYIRAGTDYLPEGEQTQGALTTIIFTPTSFDAAFDPELGRRPYSPVLGPNPLTVAEEFRTEQQVERFIGNLHGSWTPGNNLTITGLFGVDDTQEQNILLQPAFSTGPNFAGSIQNPIRLAQQYNADLTANHEYSVRETAQLTTTAGFRYTYARDNVIRAAGSVLNPGAQVISGAELSASQGITELATVGGFIQERLGFGDRLFVTGGVNVEASSAFGADDRWQLFPRLGASWIVDREPFWERLPFVETLSTLRLRAAYGETGGQPPGAYRIFNNTFNTAFSARPGLGVSSVLGNPELRPERQREYEAGFDAGFLNNRVSLEFTYYDQRTRDLVLQVPLAFSTGFSTQFQNVGVLANRGVEVTLNALPIQRDRFSWTTRLTYSTNRNEVEQLVTGADTIVVGYLNAVTVGQPVGVFYGGFYARNDDGTIKFDTRGLPVRATYIDPQGRTQFASKIIGDPNPDFSAALSNTFTLGEDISFSFLFDGRFGNDVANFTRRITEYFGSAKVTEREFTGEMVNGVLRPDTVPGTFVLNRTRIGLYEEYIEDGSFVKLREVALTYRFDPPWLQRRLGTEAIALRVAGRNLYTWTDYSGLDPEINLFSASTVARGVDFATTPIPRTVSIGLTVNY